MILESKIVTVEQSLIFINIFSISLKYDSQCYFIKS